MNDVKTKETKIKVRSRVGRRTKEMVNIAKERIKILLSLAETAAKKDKNHTRANRYVLLARKIAMRYNILIEKYYRHKICRACNSFIGSSATGRVRCHAGRVIIYCRACGNITRVPIHSRRL